MPISNAGIVGKLYDVGGMVYNAQHPDYGVTASTSVDQQTKIQNLWDDIASAGGGISFFPPGDYLCDGPLYLHGNVSVMGVYGKSTLLVDANNSTRTNKAFIAIGANSTAGTDTWSGSITNMRFAPGPNISTGVTRVLHVFSAQDYLIAHNIWDDFADDVQGIKGGDDTDWHDRTTSVRVRGRYLYNTFNLSQTTNGGEQISLSATPQNSTQLFAQDIQVIGNHIEGAGDDAIAFHAVTDGLIHGNTCKTLDGRILVANSVRVTVSDNYVEHTSTGGGSSHIYALASQDNGTRMCRNIVIANNHCWIKPGQNIGNSIRISGVQDALVEGNTVRNDSHVLTNVSVEEVTINSVDYASGRVTIQNNHLMGARLRAPNNQRNDWVHFGPNRIDGMGLFNSGMIQKIDHFDGDAVYCQGVSNIRFNNAVGTTAATQGPFDVEEDIVDAVLLGTWESTALSTGGTTTLTRLGGAGFTTVKLEDGLGFVPTKVVYNTGSVPSAGSTASIEIVDDGTVLASVQLSTADSTSGEVKWGNYLVSVNEPLGNCGGAAPGSAIGLQVNDAATGYLNGATIQAELWGVPLQAIPDDVGDANVTLSATTSPYVTRFFTTLTANRTVTLPDSTNTPDGHTFRIVSHSTGAFTIDVGGLYTIPSATPTVVDVEKADGSTAWSLVANSTLS